MQCVYVVYIHFGPRPLSTVKLGHCSLSVKKTHYRYTVWYYPFIFFGIISKAIGNILIPVLHIVMEKTTSRTFYHFFQLMWNLMICQRFFLLENLPSQLHPAKRWECLCTAANRIPIHTWQLKIGWFPRGRWFPRRCRGWKPKETCIQL